ncbi:MAG: hypothetical protein H0T97_02895 [Actinobacteria bacterium]|nr:hypothetical protein [Actinomycetota bacterium]
MRAVYRIWATLLLILVIVQVGLAGYGAFYAANKLDDEGSSIDEEVFSDGFGIHIGVGYLAVLAGLIFLVIGVVAGVGKWRLGRHGVLFALLVLQVILAWIGYGAPALGFLHPVNALLIFGLLGWIVSNEWRLSRAAPASVAASP